MLLFSPDHSRAHWVRHDTILWAAADTPGASYVLLAGPQRCVLTPAPSDPAMLAGTFPHLAGLPALRLAPADLPLIPDLLRGPLVVAAFDSVGELIVATGLQIPGVLDDLFPYAGPLGVAFDGDTPALHLWAPTARSVALLLFADSHPATPAQILPMSRDDASGAWSIVGAPAWYGLYYRYQVEVYLPALGQLVVNEVTDPYALALSTNSTRSQIVRLDDPALLPPGWADLVLPPLAHPCDIVLYELQIRDFSSFDQSVPTQLRGTYRAFTRPDTVGVAHLRQLAEAGVSHIHLLPSFDIASIEEDRARQLPLPIDQLRALPPDSAEQQALLAPLRGRDGYNWGYDPFHYTVPEGSYSTQPDGPQRSREFREMVQALAGLGLRVVLDVVYNHTYDGGQDARSVLDKIVPGYYHRLDADGRICTSTCCANTASEHAMMERLMIDSVITWARAYRVSGFRFDLMGHHMKRNLLRLRAALDALTVARDGIDGCQIYLYGEGWDFGEVAGGARGENATQFNMAGTGIGTFSDRLRDAARGGSFGDPREQGFATGLFCQPNQLYQGDGWAQRARLLYLADLIKLGLAGNLRDVRLISADGAERAGGEIPYGFGAAGYAQQPQEQIVYVSAHDNETLFDAIQLKAAAEADLDERVRMQLLALSMVALAQGVPFFHAGDELLRSKSGDRNSYSSSDWFNQIDWAGQRSAFGVGLPPAGDNQQHWPLLAPLLANPALRPGPAQITACRAGFLELLRIRRSTPLFRLRTAEQVRRAVRFFNTGPDQIAGLIVMQLHDPAATQDMLG
ncbi:MAG: pullulanase-type alpha-1,6-glucosidase, partial [Oscillochloris sp.]|nr:pullulanase-type alpha-1,6-glucosidase [Oscillochloris sp.]